MNICLIGLGRAGHFHLNSIKMIDKINLKYCLDYDTKLTNEISKQYNCIAIDNVLYRYK